MGNGARFVRGVRIQAHDNTNNGRRNGQGHGGAAGRPGVHALEGGAIERYHVEGVARRRGLDAHLRAGILHGGTSAGGRAFLPAGQHAGFVTRQTP